MSKFGASVVADDSQATPGPSKFGASEAAPIVQPETTLGQDVVGAGDSEPQELAKTGVEQALRNIPGFSEIAEFAASVNRPVIETLDFLGPDTVNAILGLAGTDKRVPTLSESIPGTQGGFIEPGLTRNVIQAAGETATLAAGGGAFLKGLASRLPSQAVAAESIGAGALRQAAGTTVVEDVALGALSGAGGALGLEAGGEVGQIAGSFVAPIAPAIAIASGKILATSTAKKFLKDAAPTIEGLKNAARGIYKEIDDEGVVLTSDAIDNLSKGLRSAVRGEGFNARIHPKVSAALDEFSAIEGTKQTLGEVDTLRRVAQQASQSIDPSEARLGNILINKVDDYLDDLGQDAFEKAPGIDIGSKFRDARQLWGRAKKSELIEDAFDRARNQASGFENGLRTQFRSILNSKKKSKGFTEEELSAMRRVVQGGSAENIAKAIGKFGFTEGQASSMLLGSAGVAGGAALGGGAGAVAVPLIGQVSKTLAQKLTRNNAELANSIVRAGKSGKDIVKAYLNATPKDQRSAEDLTELLIRQDVNIEGLRSFKNKLVNDAAFLAASIRQVDSDDKNSEELQGQQEGIQ